MPGEQLSLRTIAEGRGVSVMPVREAVHRLLSAKALVLFPNRVLRVPRIYRQARMPMLLEMIESLWLRIGPIPNHVSDGLQLIRTRRCRPAAPQPARCCGRTAWPGRASRPPA